MTAKAKKTEPVVDPLEERKNILSRHFETSKEAKSPTGQKAGKPASRQASKEVLVKMTARVPDSLYNQLEGIYLALKQAQRSQPKNEKKKVLLQDLVTQALHDYVEKMKRKTGVN